MYEIHQFFCLFLHNHDSQILKKYLHEELDCYVSRRNFYSTASLIDLSRNLSLIILCLVNKGILHITKLYCAYILGMDIIEFAS